MKKVKTTSKITAIIAVIVIMSLTACQKDDEPTLPDTLFTVSITGTINHEIYTAGQSATVVFSRFPASVEEFRSAQQQIGNEPQGAVALQLMAAEMYRRNASRGTQCIELCNVKSNFGDFQLNRWRDLFNKNDQSYYRPYQIAAFLKGATPENDYTPVEQIGRASCRERV